MVIETKVLQIDVYLHKGLKYGLLDMKFLGSGFAPYYVHDGEGSIKSNHSEINAKKKSIANQNGFNEDECVMVTKILN